MGCLTPENEYSSYTVLPFELGPGPEWQNGPRPHKAEQGKSFWTKPGSSSHLYFPLCPVTSLLPSDFLENNIFSDVLCEGWGLSGLHQRLTYNTPLKKKNRGGQMSLFYFFFSPTSGILCLMIWDGVSCSVVSNSATPWTVAHQAPLSMEFSRQEYWNWLELLAMPFSRGSSQPRNWTWLSSSVGWFFTNWAM